MGQVSQAKLRLRLYQTGHQPDRSIVSAVGFYRTVNAAFCIPTGGVFPLVVDLFALAKAQLHLYTAMLEVERQRHQGVALQLALLLKMPDLVLVRQQAARTVRVLIEDIAVS